MMNEETVSTYSIRDQLRKNLADKRYRDSFVAEQIFSGLPLKIFHLRKARFKNQQEFADKLDRKQSWVSQLENPNYGRLTLSTLLQIASACDVALEVDFVPFSRLLEKTVGLTEEWFRVPSYKDDAGFVEKKGPLSFTFSDATLMPLEILRGGTEGNNVIPFAKSSSTPTGHNISESLVIPEFRNDSIKEA